MGVGKEGSPARLRLQAQFQPPVSAAGRPGCPQLVRGAWRAHRAGARTASEEQIARCPLPVERQPWMWIEISHVGVFTPWGLANATLQDFFFFGELTVQH